MSIQSISTSLLQYKGGYKHEIADVIASRNFEDDYDYPDSIPPTEETYYDDVPRSRRRKASPSYKPRSTEPSFLSIFQNQKQLGAMLLAIGLGLSFLGVILLFERNLLRLGNICLIAGIVLLIGPNRVRGFFMKESRIQASIITALGILLVFWGKPRFGIILEIFGLLNLFGNMFPLLFAVGRRTPIIGDLLSVFDGNDNNNDSTTGGKGSRSNSNTTKRRSTDSSNRNRNNRMNNHSNQGYDAMDDYGNSDYGTSTTPSGTGNEF